jgi:hypothetical protein
MQRHRMGLKMSNRMLKIVPLIAGEGSGWRRFAKGVKLCAGECETFG